MLKNEFLKIIRDIAKEYGLTIFQCVRWLEDYFKCKNFEQLYFKIYNEFWESVFLIKMIKQIVSENYETN